MYVPDHNPPHFHARVSGLEAQITIANPDILRGELDRIAQRKVIAWAHKRQRELESNWRRIEQHLPPEEIAP